MLVSKKYFEIIDVVKIVCDVLSRYIISNCSLKIMTKIRELNYK